MIIRVKNIKNQSVSSEICPENPYEIGRFLPIVFRRS